MIDDRWFMESGFSWKGLSVKSQLSVQRLIFVSLFGNGGMLLGRVKTPEEITLLKKLWGFLRWPDRGNEGLCKPGMSGRRFREFMSLFTKDIWCRKDWIPIHVGGGNNWLHSSFTLKYDKQNLSDRLLLMDLGCRVEGYTADCDSGPSRFSGKFNEEESAAIYELGLSSPGRWDCLSKPGGKFWGYRFLPFRKKSSMMA